MIRANRIPRVHTVHAATTTPSTGWPLADWADRAPRRRWPLIGLLVLVLWGLADSGETDDATQQLDGPACPAVCVQQLSAEEPTT